MLTITSSRAIVHPRPTRHHHVVDRPRTQRTHALRISTVTMDPAAQAAVLETARRDRVARLAKHTRFSTPADVRRLARDHSLAQGATLRIQHKTAKYLCLVCASVPARGKKRALEAEHGDAAQEAPAAAAGQCAFRVTASLRPGVDHMNEALPQWRVFKSVLQHTCTPGARHLRNKAALGKADIKAVAVEHVKDNPAGSRGKGYKVVQRALQARGMGTASKDVMYVGLHATAKRCEAALPH